MSDPDSNTAVTVTLSTFPRLEYEGMKLNKTKQKEGMTHHFIQLQL